MSDCIVFEVSSTAFRLYACVCVWRNKHMAKHFAACDDQLFELWFVQWLMTSLPYQLLKTTLISYQMLQVAGDIVAFQ